MESEGQRPSSNPSQVLTALLHKRAKLHEELRNVEKQVYDMETSYLQDPSQCGNVLKGFEGFLSSSKSTTLLKRSRKFQPEDRLFSLSSITSPAELSVKEDMVMIRSGGQKHPIAEEQAAGRDGGGGFVSNGIGRPKKGRGPRDGRKMKQSSEPDFDYEDDTDLI